MKILQGSTTIIYPMGAACGDNKVCPNASASECNQTADFKGESAKWTTVVQLTMGGTPK